MTITTRGSPVGENESQGQTSDGQPQPSFQQNQVRLHHVVLGNIKYEQLDYVLINL